MTNGGGDVAREISSQLLNRIGEPSSPPEQFKPIELEEVDINIFTAKPENLWVPQGARGVFGGQVVGQSIAAATKTVSEKHWLHSIHSYFLLPGRSEKPIVYQVTRVREGASFATRHVDAIQNGKIIFTLMASFQSPEPSRLIHQNEMKTVPEPMSLQSDQDRYAAFAKDERLPLPIRDVISRRLNASNPIDIRWVTEPMDPVSQFVRSLAKSGSEVKETKGGTKAKEARPKVSRGLQQMAWMKTKARLADDPNVHRAVIAYASDYNLLGTARGNTLRWGEIGMMASLDHSMWFHAPFRADEWLLYVMESPRASMSRGLAFGYIFRTDGTLAVTVAQEGLIRLRDKPLSISAISTPPTPTSTPTSTPSSSAPPISKL